MVAVAYESWSLTRGSKYSDLTLKRLAFWKAGRLREVVATGGLTVFDFRFCLSQKNESKRHALQWNAECGPSLDFNPEMIKATFDSLDLSHLLKVCKSDRRLKFKLGYLNAFHGLSHSLGGPL